jgi:hypothetical protein
MVCFAMRMSLINSCSIHYGAVRWSSDGTSMLFDPFRVEFKWIYRPLMAIFLRHDEVAYVVVLISRQISNFASFPSARYPRDPAVTFKY